MPKFYTIRQLIDGHNQSNKPPSKTSVSGRSRLRDSRRLTALAHIKSKGSSTIAELASLLALSYPGAASLMRSMVYEGKVKKSPSSSFGDGLRPSKAGVYTLVDNGDEPCAE